jgi:hypothetical protein
MLLVGKAVACLIRSREVFDDFARKYGNTVGVISKAAKHASLLAVTTTSSMGRSAVYNRLFGVSTFETVWGFRLEEGFGLIAVT